MKSKKIFLHNILLPKNGNYKYPLLNKGLSKKDLDQGIKVLRTGNITMNKHTFSFEKKFAKKFKSKYALMVNSGSSANLLAAFAACNPLRKNKFKRGDHAIIQSLCWSTSLWPLVQSGLKINFVDVDPKTLNTTPERIISNVTKKTKVIMLVNVLGLSTDVLKIRKFCLKKRIILIEDNCESLGTRFKKKFLGTFGDFGTFSFFFSHQITSGEGGMVVCKDKKDYEILKSLRSHGWSREKHTAKKFPNLDPRYIFVNSGFNLRPMDVQAAIVSNQFKRLEKFKNIRKVNRKKIISILVNDTNWNNQFKFVDIPEEIDPSFMVLPILLNPRYKNKKKQFINYIESKGIETRPIISGSFPNQPSTKLFKLNKSNKKFKGSEYIQKFGFVIGLHTRKIMKKDLLFLKKTLLSIDKL